MEVSVSAALGHIQGFMHPQVVITNDPSREDAFFTRAIRARAFELGKTVIELPTDASENLMWIARLDSGSLAGKVLLYGAPQFFAYNVLAWQTTYIDILIHAPPHASGSLLRLLKSIEAADYFGHRRPHLTIELPADVDPPTWAFLEELTWPPLDWSGTPHQSQVTLRHRIPRQAGTAEEASARQVESFYPARPAHSHVLVLSPQIELSPMYFHYLLYQLLEYRYSSMTRESPQTKNLVGLSLELPHTHLNDSTTFSPPRSTGRTRHGDGEDEEKSVEEPTSFLWQAPNSNAALYFGDKWIELHSFLTSRFTNDPTKQPGRRKLISEIYPSWLEFLQELMRARGYTMLYPIFPSGGRDSIACLHYELFQPPEEISKRPKSTPEADAPIPPLDPKETFETDPAEHRLKPKSHSESTPLTSNLLSLLPASALPTDLSDLPLLSHEGNALDASVLESTARIFANDFRRTVGQCSATYKPKVEPMKADDLFCYRQEDAQAGLGLGDPWRGPSPPPPPPPVKDDSELRQSEFEAHLTRQGGGKEDRRAENGVEKEKDQANPKGKGVKEKAEEKKSNMGDNPKKSIENDASAQNAKERLKEAKEEKIKGKDDKKVDKTDLAAGETKEEKPRGW